MEVAAPLAVCHGGRICEGATCVRVHCIVRCIAHCAGRHDRTTGSASHICFGKRKCVESDVSERVKDVVRSLVNPRNSPLCARWETHQKKKQRAPSEDAGPDAHGRLDLVQVRSSTRTTLCLAFVFLHLDQNEKNGSQTGVSWDSEAIHARLAPISKCADPDACGSLDEVLG